jgi:hypothetical protein
MTCPHAVITGPTATLWTRLGFFSIVLGVQRRKSKKEIKKGKRRRKKGEFGLQTHTIVVVLTKL